ncbi:hypothetical protein K431DRAFT_223014 [Polychaeton citri CBS 116435]|uniref:Uncharacterized protein n=1 Tax=Polychaeton citri CBS 116435 TaxID=1314669 RepID=A0A9P4QBN4_9PEZI|nr:hypothetical protein K431DRAFT_223014 [Polychaeton citri CBS 116435]
MAGNANTTISYPGPDWEMLWGNGSFDNFQLDIVGFLAILGEGAVTANAQVSALSRLFYLPRLLPAPQALLWPARPIILSPAKATVTGVFSGNTKDHLHHIANILLVKAKSNGPLSWVTLLGCLLSAALFIISVTVGDGMSLLATILLSLLSTLAGIGNKWNLKLPQPDKDPNSKKPAADVVVRWPNGSYVIVKCDEEVARELFFAPEEIQYQLKSKTVYRLLSLIGTLMLMLGVIFLANAKLQLQFAWAGAYVILNAAHWVAAALPQRLHWDVSCYKLKEQHIEGKFPGPKCKNFTIALWKAICFTEGSVGWVATNGAAPKTSVWSNWVSKAGEVAYDSVVREDAFRIGTIDTIRGVESIRSIWNRNDSSPSIIRKMSDWNPKAAWDEFNNQVQDVQPEPLRILFPKKLEQTAERKAFGV